MVVMSDVIGDSVIDLEKQPLRFTDTGRHVCRGRHYFLNVIRQWLFELVVISRDISKAEWPIGRRPICASKGWEGSRPSLIARAEKNQI